jgi:Clp protease
VSKSNKRVGLSCYGCCRCLMIIAGLAVLSPRPVSAATFEFEGPYEIRVIHQGLALEVSGTFSWALPQQVGVALAEAPNVRLIYLDSPGGHIKAALEVAELIRAHNLDTYVHRMCASACTIAFLAGHQRLISETARLGFHQAHGPGLSSEQSNLLLRMAYQNFSLPPAFVAHVLRTPPQDLWIPDLAELRNSNIITDVASEGALAVSVPGSQHQLDK